MSSYRLIFMTILVIFLLLPQASFSAQPAGVLINPNDIEVAPELSFPGLKVGRGHLACRLNRSGRPVPALIRGNKSSFLSQQVKNRLRKARRRGASPQQLREIRKSVRKRLMVREYKRFCSAALTNHELFLAGIEGAIPRVGIPDTSTRRKNICQLGDFNSDGQINRSDLLYLLKRWNKRGTKADLNESGRVEISDLLILLNLWGTTDKCDPWKTTHQFTGLPQTVQGWTDFRSLINHPAYYNDSRIVYVSNSEGNDSTATYHDVNDPLVGDDPFNPVGPVSSFKTIAAAYNQLRHGYPDILLLRRGDVWLSEVLGGSWKKSGRSKIERMIVGSYGPHPERPLLIPGTQALFVFGGGGTPASINYLAFTDFHIYGAQKDPSHPLYSTTNQPNPGITWLQPARDVLFEDIRLEYGSWVLQFDNNDGFDFVIRRSVTEKNYSSPSPGGHAQGIYAAGITGLVIEESIFDHNGFIDRDCVSAACLDSSQGATIFNHNLYLQYDSGPAIVRDNIISRASSHGIQARAGGVIENNLLMRNPLNAFVAGGALAPLHRELSIMRNNVVIEGNDINTTTPRGLGLDHNNAYESVIEGNLIANMLPQTSAVNNRAFAVICQPGERCSSTIVNNIVYRWTDPTGRGTVLYFEGNPQDFDDMSISNNKFQKPGDNANGNMVALASGLHAIAHLFHFSGNAYYHPDIFKAGWHGATFSAGNGSINFSDWKAGVEPSAEAGTVKSFYSPCRTAATYYHELILGNDSQGNCALMHDESLFNEFMRQAKNRTRRTAPDQYVPYSAGRVNDYIRAGFRLDSR